MKSDTNPAVCGFSEPCRIENSFAETLETLKFSDKPTDSAEASDGRLPARNCSVLFIGGVADGRRIPDPEERYWKMQADFPVIPFDYPASAPIEIRREEYVYRRERIRAEREEYVIYVCDRMSAFQAIGKLVRGYSPQNVDVHTPLPAGASDETEVDR